MLTEVTSSTASESETLSLAGGTAMKAASVGTSTVMVALVLFSDGVRPAPDPREETPSRLSRPACPLRRALAMRLEQMCFRRHLFIDETVSMLPVMKCCPPDLSARPR